MEESVGVDGFLGEIGSKWIQKTEFERFFDSFVKVSCEFAESWASSRGIVPAPTLKFAIFHPVRRNTGNELAKKERGKITETENGREKSRPAKN